MLTCRSCNFFASNRFYIIFYTLYCICLQMGKRYYPRVGFPGCFGKKLHGHRIMEVWDGNAESLKNFCNRYGISRWVAYRLMKRHILLSTRCKHRRYIQIRPGCEENFKYELQRTRNLHKPRKNYIYEDYDLGYSKERKLRKL
jgi:hypothetical protein